MNLPADLTLYDALHAIAVFVDDEQRNPTRAVPEVVDVGDGWWLVTRFVTLNHSDGKRPGFVDATLCFRPTCNDAVLPAGVTRPDPHAVLRAFAEALTPPLRRMSPNAEAALKALRSL